MGLLDKLKRKVETTLAGSRLEEELMYKHAIREMDAGLIREGLYAKALSNSPGDEEKVKSLYIKYRVQSIKDELKGVSYPEYMNNLKLNVNNAHNRKGDIPISFAKVNKIKDKLGWKAKYNLKDMCSSSYNFAKKLTTK